MYLNAKSDCNFQFLLVMNRNYTPDSSSQSKLSRGNRSFQTLFSGRVLENPFSVYLSIYTGKYLNQNENTGMFLFIIDMEGGKG